jgi:geranylgeranylglycerol-phosphate geranylgeranyltransferase
MVTVARGSIDLGTKAAALWTLIRPGNCAITALGTMVGALVQAGPGPFLDTDPLLFATMAGFLFAGAGNALNDYMDRNVDRRAHPDRPIPSGRVTPGQALAVQALLFELALILAFFVATIAVVVVAVSLILMVAYETRFKARGLPGNIVIGLLTGVPFVMGAIAVGGVGQAVLILSLLAGLATLGREVIKDIEDMDADEGRTTLPMRVGKEKAWLFARGVLIVGVLLSPLAYLEGGFAFAFLPLILVADAGFIYASLQTKAPAKGSRYAKISMLIALLAFVAGKVTP